MAMGWIGTRTGQARKAVASTATAGERARGTWSSLVERHGIVVVKSTQLCPKTPNDGIGLSSLPCDGDAHGCHPAVPRAHPGAHPRGNDVQQDGPGAGVREGGAAGP